MQLLIPRQAAITLSLGGVQAMQVLIPRQASLVPQPGRRAGSAGTHSQAGSISPPSQKECRHSLPGRQHQSPRWEGVQALFPRKAASVPLARSAGSAGAHSQAGSANPQSRRSASNAGAHSQTGSISPPSQEGFQAVQVLIPRQAALTLSPGGVQAMLY